MSGDAFTPGTASPPAAGQPPGAKGREAAPGGLPPVPPVASAAEFEQLVAEIDKAAHEWGVRPDSKEGKFVAALLGSTRWAGHVNCAALAEFKRLLDEFRDNSKDELARVQQLGKATNVMLSQARQATLSLEVEHANLALRMVEKTLPKFIECLQGALVLRERRLNADLQRRRYAVVGLVVLALVGSGYGLRAWQDRDATGALGECLAHPLQAQGQTYCNVTRLLPLGQ